MTNIVIPPGVTIIPSGCFSYCLNSKTVTIHSQVTSIGSEAFKKCEKLTEIVMESSTPPTLGTGGDGVFYGTNSCPIYVPDAAVNTYKTAPVWSDYADRITGISNRVVE